MAWRIAIVTEEGAEKLEMSPDELKAFIIKCATVQSNGNSTTEYHQSVIRAIEAGFEMADRYLRQQTVKLR